MLAILQNVWRNNGLSVCIVKVSDDCKARFPLHYFAIISIDKVIWRQMSCSFILDIYFPTPQTCVLCTFPSFTGCDDHVITTQRNNVFTFIHRWRNLFRFSSYWKRLTFCQIFHCMMARKNKELNFSVAKFFVSRNTWGENELELTF